MTKQYDPSEQVDGTVANQLYEECERRGLERGRFRAELERVRDLIGMIAHDTLGTETGLTQEIQDSIVDGITETLRSNITELFPAQQHSDQLAHATVNALLEAYANGLAAGGSMNWTDVDEAYELAVDSRNADPNKPSVASRLDDEAADTPSSDMDM